MTGAVLTGQQNLGASPRTTGGGAPAGRDRSVGAIKAQFEKLVAAPERLNPSDFHRSFGTAPSEVAYTAALTLAESVETPYLEQRPGGGMLSTSAQILLAETRTREAEARSNAIVPSSGYGQQNAGNASAAGRALGAYQATQAQVDATIRASFNGY